MARAKKTKAPNVTIPASFPLHVPVDNGWVTSDAYTLPNGRQLAAGATVTIQGERGGRFTFLSHVRRPDGAEWLNVIGGASNVKMFRSFRPERISRVLKGRFA